MAAERDDAPPVPQAAHPRLYLDPDRLERTPEPAGDPLRRRLADEVATAAASYVAHPDFQELPSTHNAHLIRARRMQSRVLTLVTQWLRTADQRYRDSAVAHLRTMGDWEYWSWITWRRADPRPEAIFDLSYGENSATLGLAYDLLYADLDDGERQSIVDIARRRSLRPFGHVLEHDRPSWFGRPDSNWNAVCAGGAGILALAVYEDAAEARQVLAAVEESIRPFMESLAETDGGWPEGIGYWNYGMRYAFMYLLSHERAVGEPHPLMSAEPTRKTLDFPLDFCPYGQPCSFGDSNHWTPLPFHYAAARRLGCRTVLRTLAAGAARGDLDTGHGSWPGAAEALMLLPDDPGADDPGADDPGAGRAGDAAGVPPPSGVRVYEGLGWARLADRWPDPNLYLSIRGGTTEVPHGHADLLSFYAVVNGETMIENLTPVEYLDTTFGSRRSEMFEMTPQSKNVPLVEGVGIVGPARVDPRLEEFGAYPAVRLDATEAIGVARSEEPLAEFCGRLFVLLDRRAVLVLDRVDLCHEGRVESRLHTRADVEAGGGRARLVGRSERMTVAFGANLPFGLSVASTVPTTPGDEASVLRWHGPRELARHFVMASLLVPGESDADVSVESAGDGLRVRMRAGSWHEELSVTADLRPAGSESTSTE